MRDIGERKLALRTQLPQSNPYSAGASRSIIIGAHQPVSLEHLDNGGRIQSAHAPKKTCALEKLDINRFVKPILARRTPGTGEAQAFPRANHGRRDAHQTGYISDFQVSFRLFGLHPEPHSVPSS